MPTYEFHCEKCKAVFDRKTPVGVRVTTCACGGIAYYRFVPSKAVQFKVGIGFHTSREDLIPDEPVKAHYKLGGLPGKEHS